MWKKKNENKYCTICESISIHLERCIRKAYGLVMACILFCCVFLAQRMEYAWKRIYMPELMLLVTGICLAAGYYTFCKQLKFPSAQIGKLFLAAVALMVFFVEVICVKNYYFYTGWDVPQLVGIGDAIAHGSDTSSWSWYFSRYPNNLPTAVFFSFIYRAVHAMGRHEQEYFSVLVVQCGLNSMAGVVIVDVVDKLFHDVRMAALAYVLYIALIATSPWTSIPYTDATGLLMPILLIDLYVRQDGKKNPFLSWFLITAIAFIGYHVKPQILIAWIALLLVEVIHLIRDCISGGRMKLYFRKFMAVVIGGFCAWVFVKAAISSAHVTLNEEAEFQMPHFFMMGMDSDWYGVYDEDDVLFSASFDTVEERNAADMQQGFTYIRNMGVTGTLEQMIRKTMTNYNDGTFAWAAEGHFYTCILERKSSSLTDWLRSLYYMDTEENTVYPGR